MGTRCATYFTDDIGAPPADDVEANKLVEACIFRHWDGYLQGAGEDIQTFLKKDRAATEGTRVGDSSMLAARYVAFLAHHFNAGGKERTTYSVTDGIVRKPATGRKNPCDFLSVRVMPPELGSAGDVEFDYWIDGAGTVYVRHASYGWGSHPSNHGEWMTFDAALEAELQAELAG